MNPDQQAEIDQHVISAQASRMDSRFYIRLYSFLRAGGNINLVDTYGDTQRLTYTAKTPTKIHLTLNEDSYTAVGYIGDTLVEQISGFLDVGNFTIDIDNRIPDIEANDELSLDLVIKNDSDRDISIKFSNGKRRIRVFDRNKSEIVRVSETENVVLR